MIAYVILLPSADESPESMTTKEEYNRAVKQKQPWVLGKVVREFEAMCWCDAMQHYHEAKEFGPYDMWECDNEWETKGDLKCALYFEMKARQDELKNR